MHDIVSKNFKPALTIRMTLALTTVGSTYIRVFAIMVDASLGALCLGVLIILSYNYFWPHGEGKHWISNLRSSLSSEYPYLVSKLIAQS